MHTFTDSLGEVWDVEINGGTIRRAEKYLGIDLGKPRVGDDPWLPRFENAENITFKVDLIYVICMPEIRRRGWSDEDFAGLLDKDALRDASVAIYGALTDFFLTLGMQENAIATQAQLAMLPEVYGAAARRSQSFLTRLLGTSCASSQRSPAVSPSPEPCTSSA